MDPLIKKHAVIVFSYLFGAITKYEYRDLIGDRAEAKALWALIASNGYVLKNCKLYAYAQHVARAQGLAISPARFGIEQGDVKILKDLDLSYISTKYKALSLFDFDNLEGAILKSSAMNTYIGKFISKKLIFLCRSYGLSRTEIHGDLQCAALFAVRKKYPFYKTELHATNICKAAIANHGKGIIEFWTRAKRNALMKENGTFQAVHVQYEMLNDVGVEPEHDSELRINIQSLCSLAEKMPEQERFWVNTAAGIHDPGFSFYIGKDNRDAVEVLSYTKYIDLLCAYHHVCKDKMISKLRKALA